MSQRRKTTRSCGKYLAESPFVAMKPIHRRLVLGFFVLYLASVTIFAFASETVGAELVIPVLILTTIINIAPLILYRRWYGWFHPLIFGALFGVVGLLRKFPIYAFGLGQSDGLPGYDEFDLATLVALSLAVQAGSQLAYYAGFFKAPRIRVPKLRLRQLRGVRLKACLVVCVILVFFGIYMAARGGIIAHLLFLGRGRSVLIASGEFSGEWIIGIQFGVLACLLWLASDRRAIRHPLFWLSFISSVMCLFVLTGSRSSVIYFVAIGLIVWMMREKRIAMISLSIFAVISVFLIGIMGDLREKAWRGEFDLALIAEGGPTDSLVKGGQEMAYRSGALNPIYPILARVPNEIGLLYGRSYLTLATIPVPRAWWPEKPRSTGVEVGQVFLNTIAPVPPDAIAEAYWNFHVPGVIVLFFLFGVFHRWMAVFFQRNASQKALLPVYAFTILALSPTVLAIVQWLQVMSSFLVLFFLFGVIAPPVKHKRTQAC